MSGVIFSEVLAKIATDVASKVLSSVVQHEKFFEDIGKDSGTRCFYDHATGVWTLCGDLSGIVRAHCLLSAFGDQDWMATTTSRVWMTATTQYSLCELPFTTKIKEDTNDVASAEVSANDHVADESLENFLSSVIKGEGKIEMLSEANRFDLNVSK